MFFKTRAPKTCKGTEYNSVKCTSNTIPSRLESAGMLQTSYWSNAHKIKHAENMNLKKVTNQTKRTVLNSRKCWLWVSAFELQFVLSFQCPTFCAIRPMDAAKLLAYLERSITVQFLLTHFSTVHDRLNLKIQVGYLSKPEVQILMSPCCHGDSIVSKPPAEGTCCLRDFFLHISWSLVSWTLATCMLWKFCINYWLLPSTRQSLL